MFDFLNEIHMGAEAGAGVVTLFLLAVAVRLRKRNTAEAQQKVKTMTENRRHLQPVPNVEILPLYEVQELTLEDWERGRGLVQPQQITN